MDEESLLIIAVSSLLNGVFLFLAGVTGIYLAEMTIAYLRRKEDK